MWWVMARRSTPFRDRNPVTIGAVSLAVIALLVLLAFNAESLPFIGGGTVYQAYFSESAGLKPDDPVRVAGVKVGKVDSLELDRGAVLVTFRVKDAFLGDQTEGAIQIETLLGAKYLALVPEGSTPLDPDTKIPLSRTASPYDVVQAFSDLSSTVHSIDTTQLATSFEVLSQTFSGTPDEVKSSLQGLARLSQTISSRDDQLKQLLSATRSVTQVLADRNGEFTTLITDSNTLLQEVQARRQLIDQILTSTQQLSTQLSGLVADNTRTLTPALQQLSTVTQILEQNRENLGRTVANLAPFVRVFTNTLGNGRWFDSYVENLVPGVVGSVLCGTASATPLPVGCTTGSGG
jgi:phospholipid/cholesterol/gamma-HCH transport system substrate-binding protein